MKKKIFLVGPLFPPIHGQSLAFTRFVESINKKEKIVINTNLENKGKFFKVFGTFKVLFLIVFISIFYKYDTVYFTCSRSFLGSIKDIVLINLVSLRKIKVINHLHGSDFYEFFHSTPKYYQKLLSRSYNKVDTSIVLLNSMKGEFRDFENMKLKVVPNFYDQELDNKIVEKEANKINLLYLSNIMCSKGIFELIDSFEELCKIHDDVYLNIAGGYISDEFMNINEVKEKFILKIKGNTRINYLGKIFGEKKTKLLQFSDIFILPTYYKSEAFPISIIEAMVCENAIVTTNYKYLPKVISSKNGLLIEPKSVKSLFDAINLLIKDKNKLRTIQNGNKREAINKYSYNQYKKKLTKIVN